MLVSFIIPVYRSEKYIYDLYANIVQTMTEAEYEFEIILVDDSSPDNTWHELVKIQKTDSRVTAVQLARNFGQHKALLCGFQIAKGDYFVTMDDDFQHPPTEVPKLIGRILQDDEVDVVIGDYQVKKHSFVRNLASKIINVITSSIFDKDPNLKLTSFRVFRRLIADELLTYNTVRPRIGNMILQTSNRIVNVKVRHDERKHGVSGYKLSRLIKDFFDNIFNYTVLPLRIASFIGILSSTISFIAVFGFLARYYLIGSFVQGWLSNILLILFIGGTILLSLGFIGEYLIRILNEVQRTTSPPAVIRRKLTTMNDTSSTNI